MTTVPEEFAGQLPLHMQFGVEISQDFLLAFNIIAIIITTVFGSLILGLIGSGREKAGIRYMPVLVAAALMIFFGTRLLIATVFGSMIPL